MAPPEVNYALYLVTDSTPAILGDKDLVAVVKAAVDGGEANQFDPENVLLTHDQAPPSCSIATRRQIPQTSCG